jgi:hypothetical protein
MTAQKRPEHPGGKSGRDAAALVSQPCPQSGGIHHFFIAMTKLFAGNPQQSFFLSEQPIEYRRVCLL